jgi:hypothetical protein
MPSVFLSYSRDDLPLIDQLEAQLKQTRTISIWRDQENIRGGQKWPKVLGEAIADQDVFLLAWSKNSQRSHFVEFEWCTAIALKKTIVPCLLDSTPLPPSLTATNAISVNDFREIVMAITGAGSATDTGLRTQVIGKLAEITATKEEDVLVAAKSSFDQQNWTVHGNVIQGEHVTVQIGQQTGESTKGFAEKWQTWVGVVVGVLTAATLVVELPKKIEPEPVPKPSPGTTKTVDPEKPKLQFLGGAIRNEANDPLPDVQVSLPQFNLTSTTDPLGQFRFEVTASNQETIALLAQKPGYQPYETDVTAGNTSLGFTMKKRQ